MPIHDELIRALTEWDEHKNIPLVRIVRTAAIDYHTHQYLGENMCPDLVVEYHRPQQTKVTLIEVESDDDFNFQRSMIQIRKYQKKYGDVRVIIPTEYERFARLYDNEKFKVYLWRAVRVYRCSCGEKFDSEERSHFAKCPNCNKTGKVILKDIKGLEISDEWRMIRELRRKTIHRKE